MQYDSAKLLLRQTRSMSQAQAYIADEELVRESNLGQLFMVVEIFSREKKVSPLIEQMVANIEADYYNSPTSDPETSLETACQNFNNILPDLVDRPISWLSKLHIMVGAVKEDEIFLSHFGNFKTILIRDNKIINIIPEKKEPHKAKDNKIFSSLISGEIKPYDIYLFSNPTLFDYFAKEKIKKTLSSLNPDQSTEYFKNLLTENTNPVSFASVIFKFNANTAINTQTPETQTLKEFYGTKESMEGFEATQRKTSSIMTSNLLPNIKNFLKRKPKISTKKTGLELPSTNSPIPTPPKATLTELHKKASKLPYFSFDFISSFFFTTTSFIKKWIYRIRHLDKKSKIIGISAVGLVLVFILSTYVTGYINDKKQIDIDFQTEITKVEDMISASEAALIYQDEEKALFEINQARLVLQSIEIKKETWQQEVDDIDSKINIALNKIHHIYQAEVKNLVDLKSTGAADLIGLTAIDSNIYVASPNNVYKVNPSDNSYTPEIENINLLTLKTWNKDNLIYTNNEGVVTTYNLTEKSSSKKSLNLTENEASDYTVYADRIYFTHPTSSQIFKVNSPLSASPAITAWYNDDPLLIAKATQILVDGDIWLATSNNGIKRFFKGKDQDFQIQELDKDLGADIEFYTETDWNKIYILDKQNSRILIVRKSGVIEKQLKNEQLSLSSNLQISTDQIKAWLTTGSKIIELDLTTE